MNHKKTKTPAIRPTEALNTDCAGSKPIRSARRQASKAEPPYRLGMYGMARRALSAAAMRMDDPETLRELESVPSGAWRFDWFIDAKAKHAIRALRRGRGHEVTRSLRASFALPVYPEDLPRYCAAMAQLHGEALQ